MKNFVRLGFIAAFVAGLLVSGCGSEAPSQEVAPVLDQNSQDISTQSVKPDGKNLPQGHNRARNGSGGNGISYHGGPVMLGTPNVYMIWYGDWSSRQSAIDTSTVNIPDFLNHLSGSPYFQINTTYNQGPGPSNKVSGNLHLAGTYFDSAYSSGTALTDSNIWDIALHAISAAPFPVDSNGIYVVVPSPEVSVGNFCSTYCGWHTHGAELGIDMKIAFVGDAERCPSICMPSLFSVNGSYTLFPNNSSTDAIANILAHELDEAVTDPDLNAWYDSAGNECADKCAWTWGTTYTTSNGAPANVLLGTRNYLIQQNWVNASGGFCAMHK